MNRRIKQISRGLVFLSVVLIGGCYAYMPPVAQNKRVPLKQPTKLVQQEVEPNPAPVQSEDEPVIPKIDDTKPVVAQPNGKVVGKQNVFLHVLPDGKKRVLVNAFICRREGQLEVLLCRYDTKEHEAILTAKVDARMIHTALLLAGAEKGSPVQFLPKYKPAHGSVIKVSVQYKDKNGKIKTVPAQQWIQNLKTKKAMTHHWVFGGSKLFPVGPNEPPIYAANDGTVICISNFDNAMLDLPVEVSEADNQLIFGAFTERIPPVGTTVQVILEPVLMNQKKTK